MRCIVPSGSSPLPWSPCRHRRALPAGRGSGGFAGAEKPRSLWRAAWHGRGSGLRRQCLVPGGGSRGGPYLGARGSARGERAGRGFSGFGRRRGGPGGFPGGRLLATGIPGRAQQPGDGRPDRLGSPAAAGGRQGRDFPFRRGGADRSRDLEMANRLAEPMAAAPDRLFLVLAGNFHTQLTKGRQDYPDFEPMGYFLAKKLPGRKFLALDILYSGGSAWICQSAEASECGEQKVGGKADAPRLAGNCRPRADPARPPRPFLRGRPAFLTAGAALT